MEKVVGGLYPEWSPVPGIKRLNNNNKIEV